jgi:hypothetical protein
MGVGEMLENLANARSGAYFGDCASDLMEWTHPGSSGKR